ARGLDDWLQEAAHRWLARSADAGRVRFVADISVIARWSDAKESGAVARTSARPTERLVTERP
ncbi:MAG: hypothetical protein ABWZ42_06075, partial [Ilumatobacteraceae bacterium]